MTTVLAWARGDRVVMGADSRCNVYERPVDIAKKIIRLRLWDKPEEHALIGMAGDYGLLQSVRYGLELYQPDDGEHLDVWAHKVANRVTKIAQEVGCLSDEGRQDGSFVLAFRGRVWTCWHAYALAHPDGIAAVGSGEGPAVGALDALLRTVGPDDASPAEVVQTALEIAVARDRGTDGPIVLETC